MSRRLPFLATTREIIVVGSALILVGTALAAAPAAGQLPPTAGPFFGRVESRQVRPGDDSEPRDDVVVGAFVDAQTPIAWMSVLAEATFVRRGGTYREAGPSGLERSARVSYLSAAVVPHARLRLGPLAPYPGLGFALESEVGTSAPRELALDLEEPATQVFALVALAGLELRLTERWFVRGELRKLEQISPAFRPVGGDVHHRSTEIALKVGVRLAR